LLRDFPATSVFENDDILDIWGTVASVKVTNRYPWCYDVEANEPQYALTVRVKLKI
jgi:hypothetical protein